MLCGRFLSERTRKSERFGTMIAESLVFGGFFRRMPPRIPGGSVVCFKGGGVGSSESLVVGGSEGVGLGSSSFALVCSGFAFVSSGVALVFSGVALVSFGVALVTSDPVLVALVLLLLES